MQHRTVAIAGIIALLVFGFALFIMFQMRPNVGITVTRDYQMVRASPLVLAILHDDDVELVAGLVEADPAAAHAPSLRGYPVQIAAELGRRDVLSLLIEEGADVNVGEREGERGHAPIWYAITNNDLDVAEILLKAGADLDIQGRQGESPADYARRLGHRDMELLLQAAELGKGDRMRWE